MKMNILNSINLIDTLNGREKALLIWLLVVLTYILESKKTRPSVLSLIKTFSSWKILTPLLVMFAYSGISIWILTNVGIWNVSLLKDTIFWLLGTAVVLLFNTNKASQNPALFKTMMLETVAFTVLIEFLANLYSLSFIAEFIIMPFVFFIAGMSTLADSRDEYKVARKPLKIILTGYGLFVLLFSVSLAIRNFTGLFSIHNLLTLVVPSVLTVMYLPFIYVFALIMAYETLFVRIDSLLRDNRELAGFTKMKIFSLCYFDLRLLSQFSQNTGVEIFRIKDKRDTLKLIQNFKIRNKK